MRLRLHIGLAIALLAAMALPTGAGAVTGPAAQAFPITTIGSPSTATLTFIAQSAPAEAVQSVSLIGPQYSARTHRRLREPGLQDVPVAGVRLEAPTDRSFVQVWVPPVASGGSCFARFELVTHEGTLLAVADSPPFTPSL